MDESIQQLTDENSVSLVSLGLCAGILTPAEGIQTTQGCKERAEQVDSLPILFHIE